MIRNLLVALLLAIFSVQGAVAAFGLDIVQVSSPQATQVTTIASFVADVVDNSADDGNDDGDARRVSPTIEELSDYVPPELPVLKAQYQHAPPVSLPVHILSIDLPRIKPPPRA